MHGALSPGERAAADARDAEKINRFAKELNAERQDVLAYQSLDQAMSTSLIRQSAIQNRQSPVL